VRSDELLVPLLAQLEIRLVPATTSANFLLFGVGTLMSEAKRLTIQDPVDPDTMQQFTALDSARYEIGSNLLDLEQERIKLLAAAHQVDAQKKRMFERVLTERGLPSDTKVSIDFKTGAMTLLSPTPTPAQPE
jgi:hypothetical protein